jgi:hypothetical protein
VSDQLEAQQLTLGAYRDELRDAARGAGEEAARRGDPDGFAIAVDEIRRLARGHVPFTADALELPPGHVNGAAFASLARRGEIVCVGFTTSTRPLRRGALQRIWQGVDP